MSSSSDSAVYTIVIDGKRLLAISIIIATAISFTSIYVSGYFITESESLPFHIQSVIINGTPVTLGSTISLPAGAPFTANLTVLYAEAYFSPYGYYYASYYEAPPGGYYATFPQAAQGHQAIISVYRNDTFSPVELNGWRGSLTTGGQVTYNYTLHPLAPGEYIIKFLVWSDWISRGGSRIADNSGNYVYVRVVG